MPRAFLAGFLLFVGAGLALGLGFIRTAAPTFDEAPHLAKGYSYLAAGDFRLDLRDHPPLAEMWAALPLLALAPDLHSGHPDFTAARLFHYADLFLFHNKVPADAMLGPCRAFALCSWLLLAGWALAAWSPRISGPSAAPWACFAAAFSPVLISNFSLVTTDGGSAVFFFLAFWILSFEDRPPLVWGAAGICAGLALASKFNMVFLFPFALAALIAELLISRKAFPWSGAALFAAAAVTTLAAVYRFTQIPRYFQGLLAMANQMADGRASFLHGAYGEKGFPCYFPAAFALKTPLPILACGLWTSASWALRPNRERMWVLVPMVLYFLCASASKVQIGVRHLLPMIPFFALAAGCGLARVWERSRWAAGLLAAWTAVSVLRVEPFLLAYFNEAAGGPENGRNWLVDSNLDWGQDLKALGEGLKKIGGPAVFLSYFGTADPAAYGIRYAPVLCSPQVERRGSPPEPGPVLLAVSATNLKGVYFSDKALFSWLESRKPVKSFGHSIFLYDLTRDQEGRRRLARLAAISGRPEFSGVLVPGGAS
jgi:4-amino-4-deoxy-L-arabinose transferase-like glycosyltransferase